MTCRDEHPVAIGLREQRQKLLTTPAKRRNSSAMLSATTSARDMMYAESRGAALKARKKFEAAFQHDGKAVRSVVDNWERLTAYYDFPAEHWKYLRTSKIVESPFSQGYGCVPQPRDVSNLKPMPPA